jgi:hypothetical protein
MMFPSPSESLRLELIMIGAPLIFEVMQFSDVRKHHHTCLNFDSTDFYIFCYCETRADWDWRVDSQGFIDAILKVLILHEV